MPGLHTAAFRVVGQDDAIPDGFVVPFYLSDRKLRISVARAGDDLYAFDDLCTCAGNSCPLSGGLLTGTRSCANATARSAMSPPAPWSTVRRPGRSTCTTCRWPTAASVSGHDHIRHAT
jgi:hypothetical protein